jgi:hypothetical protein
MKKRQAKAGTKGPKERPEIKVFSFSPPFNYTPCPKRSDDLPNSLRTGLKGEFKSSAPSAETQTGF